MYNTGMTDMTTTKLLLSTDNLIRVYDEAPKIKIGIPINSVIEYYNKCSHPSKSCGIPAKISI